MIFKSPKIRGADADALEAATHLAVQLAVQLAVPLAVQLAVQLPSAPSLGRQTPPTEGSRASLIEQTCWSPFSAAIFFFIL